MATGFNTDIERLEIRVKRLEDKFSQKEKVMKITDEIVDVACAAYHREANAATPYGRERMRIGLEAVFALIEKESADNAQSKDDIFNSMPPELPLLDDERPQDEGWIKHTINKQPVNDDVIVIVEYRDCTRTWPIKANTVNWNSPHPDCKPARYRIVDKPEPEKEKTPTFLDFRLQPCYSDLGRSQRDTTEVITNLQEDISLYLDKYMKEKD